jgi:hypothetical protein
MDPEVRVRFPVLPDFLRNSGSGTGSTQPREYNWGASWKKSSDSGLEIREYGSRDLSRLPRGALYPQKLALTSPTKWRSLGRHSSLLDSVLQPGTLTSRPQRRSTFFYITYRTYIQFVLHKKQIDLRPVGPLDHREGPMNRAAVILNFYLFLFPEQTLLICVDIGIWYTEIKFFLSCFILFVLAHVSPDLIYEYSLLRGAALRCDVKEFWGSKIPSRSPYYPSVNTNLISISWASLHPYIPWTFFQLWNY